MNATIANNFSLSDFIKRNKDKLYTEGRKNVNLNKNGLPTISRDDPWFNEKEWDKHFKRMPQK